ncbi:hypothetical protein BC941DRAFT_66914 [Chlamydoabsidia padenii]|nr:hypothetical protein BC941DRAFT_66914 [Chlamydoabsidia padenii]
MCDDGENKLIFIIDEVPEKLHAQHQELYQVLDKALEKMRLASEVRIEQWKRVELERLEEESKKARDESNTLWKKVLSVNQQAKHNDNGDKTTPLATPTTESTPLTSTENPLASNEQVANNDLTLETRRSSHGIQFMDNTNDPGRSTVLGSRRRSSFSLDQNIIANRTNEPTPDVNQLGAVKENDSSSDDEDMFHLDEELPSDDDGDQQEQTDEQDTDTMAKASTSVESLNQSVDINQKGDSSKYGSSWIKKKRLGGKYINDFETSTDREEKEHGDGTEDLSKSISAFATSMPINIHSSSIGDFLASQDKNDDDTTSQQPTNNVSSRVIQPLFPSKQNTASYSFAPTKTTSSASFVGYDFSFSDRLLSKQFPDYNPERRKSVSTVSGRRHPQLDALIEKSSLDTRSMKK